MFIYGRSNSKIATAKDAVMATIHRAKIVQIESLQDLQKSFYGRLRITHNQGVLVIAFQPDDEHRLEEIMSRGGQDLFEKRSVYL